MAGDWIKVEENMPDKPEVSIIASRLGIDLDSVAGKLIRVWAWAGRNCNGDGVTPVTAKALLDRHSGVTGFADSMIEAGWLLVEGEQMRFPNFNRHCSKTAKERALGKARVESHRYKRNGETVTKALPEKRREENIGTHLTREDVPSVEAVIEYGTRLVPPCSENWARKWWEQAEGVGWIDKNGNPVRKWKPLFSAWWRGVQETDRRHAALKGQGRSQQPIKPGAYDGAF